MSWLFQAFSWVNSIDGFIADLVKSLLSVSLGVWLTIQFGLKRFITEKWWEKRESAYDAVILATYHAFQNVDEVLHAEVEEHTISEGRQRDLEEMAKQAFEKIAEAKTIGSLKLSNEFLARLHKLDTELEEAGNIPGERPSWYTHLAESHDAYRTCLDDLQSIARKDLKL